MEWYVSVLKKYAVFEGRARRKEYWMFTLVNVLVAIALYIGVFVASDAVSLVFLVLIVAYWVAVLLPSLGVTIRRLHDTGKSGWWILIALVPFVGGLILLIFTVLPGDAADNAFGPDPKAVQPA